MNKISVVLLYFNRDDQLAHLILATFAIVAIGIYQLIHAILIARIRVLQTDVSMDRLCGCDGKNGEFYH